MSGINPAIETDLVGELVRVDYWQTEYATTRVDNWRTVARGRVRAVTSTGDGSIALWIEVIDEECRNQTKSGTVNVGDIVVQTIERDSFRTQFCILRSLQ